MKYKKIAFFVEGFTEQYFLEKLLKEIFSRQHISISIKKLKGGNKVPFQITDIQSDEVHDQIKYFILIYNCGGDSNVKSYILETRENLISNGYSKIIGFRDIYPEFKYDEIEKLKRGLMFRVPQKDIVIDFVLSVMEIESWFLGETNHFAKIDSGLTLTKIQTDIGINLSLIDVEQISEPANTLHSIYNLVGVSYDKTQESIEKTIDLLDFGYLYFEGRQKIASLNSLINSFETELV